MHETEEKRLTQGDDPIGKKILDAAVDIMKQEGYENLTIRGVAKKSGCSNSAIYQRFEDKNGLGRAVAALQTEAFLAVMDETYRKDEDLLSNLNRIFNRLFEMLYSFSQEDIHMQILYRGSLPSEKNPFLQRIELYLRTAMERGEIWIENIKQTAFLISASFWGFVQMFRAGKSYDIETAKAYLEAQNHMMYSGIRIAKREDAMWEMLKEKGVNVEKALERVKGNKDAYKGFLLEFFADPDFKALGKEIETGNIKNAFEYAHGLKGMAANLGLDEVNNKLNVLVEILRAGKLEGADEAYGEVMKACDTIAMFL